MLIARPASAAQAVGAEDLHEAREDDEVGDEPATSRAPPRRARRPPRADRAASDYGTPYVSASGREVRRTVTRLPPRRSGSHRFAIGTAGHSGSGPRARRARACAAQLASWSPTPSHLDGQRPKRRLPRLEAALGVVAEVDAHEEPAGHRDHRTGGCRRCCRRARRRVRRRPPRCPADPGRRASGSAGRARSWHASRSRRRQAALAARAADRSRPATRPRAPCRSASALAPGRADCRRRALDEPAVDARAGAEHGTAGVVGVDDRDRSTDRGRATSCGAGRILRGRGWPPGCRAGSCSWSGRRSPWPAAPRHDRRARGPRVACDQPRLRRRQQDAWCADLADGELHGLGRAEADAVPGSGDESLQQPRQAAGPDLLDRVGAALGDRHHPLADGDQAHPVGQRTHVAGDHLRGIVGRGDEVSPHRVTGIDDAVHRGVQRPILVRLVEDSHRPLFGHRPGGSRNRWTRATPGIEGGEVVGVSGLEPETSALSGQCSNQLS